MMRPVTPVFLPSWGRARAHDYGVLVAAYELAPEESVAEALVPVIEFLSLTPKCPSYVIDDAYRQLRDWNASWPVTDLSLLPCPRCGERRTDSVEGEGSVVQHAQVVSVTDAKEVTVRPKGCAHASFALHCVTCDFRWGVDEYKAKPLPEPQVEVHYVPLRPPSEKPGDLN